MYTRRIEAVYTVTVVVVVKARAAISAMPRLATTTIIVGLGIMRRDWLNHDDILLFVGYGC